METPGLTSAGAGARASWRRSVEDSGYHTPYTPGSASPGPGPGEGQGRRRRAGACPGEPRRASKRTLQEESTPTGALAGGLQRLAVTEEGTPEPSTATSDYFSRSFAGESSRPLSYPTTPVKSSRCKIARLSPRLERSCSRRGSPARAAKENVHHPRRSVKKLNFARNRVDSQKNSLKSELKVVRTIFAPDQKIDVLAELYKQRNPAVDKILSCLEGRDLYSLSLVSPTWLKICASNKRANDERIEYIKFIDLTKENHKNRDRASKVDKQCVESEKLSLRDIHNLPNPRTVPHSPRRSPPGTPRTNKFRKFAKSASLDSRPQVSCVNCRHPAKLTEECSGEQWAECSNATCAYQFCRFCNSARHPDRKCFRYDLDAASPSKRRKHSCVIGTKKNRKNLQRLLY